MINSHNIQSVTKVKINSLKNLKFSTESMAYFLINLKGQLGCYKIQKRKCSTFRNLVDEVQICIGDNQINKNDKIIISSEKDYQLFLEQSDIKVINIDCTTLIKDELYEIE